MRNRSRGYILQEYGSWSVLVVAWLSGCGVARACGPRSLALLIGLAFLVNSKQALAVWMRSSRRQALWVMLAQMAAGAATLFALFGGDSMTLLPLLAIPAAYLASNKIVGEHAIITELLGFALLSVAALLAHNLSSRLLDLRLYAAVALYFTAGVFKIRAVLTSRMLYRILTVVYALFATAAYQQLRVPLIVLLPLAENALAAVTLYKVKLQTTGWIEVAKSLAFLGLLIGTYS